MIIISYKDKVKHQGGQDLNNEDESAQPMVKLLADPAKDGPDLRFAGPLHKCICGCDLWHGLVKFKEGEIAFYFLDVLCAACGAHAIAPTHSEDAA